MFAFSLTQYTWTNSRLWRKNRRKGTLCDGVDLNRNYNDRWGGVSSSSCTAYNLNNIISAIKFNNLG